MRLIAAATTMAALMAAPPFVSAFTATHSHSNQNLLLMMRNQKHFSTATTTFANRLFTTTVDAAKSSTAARVPPWRHYDCTNKVVTRNLELPLSSNSDDNSEARNESNNGFSDDGLELSLPYALTWVGFLAFAFYMSSVEAPGASQVVLDKFLADPIAPGVNELFATVFNLLGLIPIPLACLLLPGAKGQKLPVVPFLASSFLAGYGGLGPYLSVARKPVTSISKQDLDWVTANVLENKLFNWIFVALTLSTFLATGLVQELLTDPQHQVDGYVELVRTTAIASASSCDLVILTLTAASLIPEDLKRRGIDDSSRAHLIAASTILLPVVGSTIYCAFRPSLPEE